MKKNYVELGMGYEFHKDDVPPARSKMRYALNDLLSTVWRKGVAYFSWDDGPSSCLVHWIMKLEKGYGYFKFVLNNEHSGIMVAYDQLTLHRLDILYEWRGNDAKLPSSDPAQPKVHFGSGDCVQLLVDAMGFRQGTKGEVTGTNGRGEFVDVYIKRLGATITVGRHQLQLVKKR